MSDKNSHPFIVPQFTSRDYNAFFFAGAPTNYPIDLLITFQFELGALCATYAGLYLTVHLELTTRVA